MRVSLSSILAFASAGTVLASTPPGTQPSSNNNLIVVFGATVATQGRDVLRSITADSPELGTAERLYGTYTLMMVDYDIPSNPPSKLLHWMQPGLVSSTIQTSLAGTTIHRLTNNTAPSASYRPPNPPDRAPLSHRYVQMLLNTTNNPNADAIISRAAANRTAFDPEKVVRDAGVSVVAGNWFNVTFGSNGTATSPSGTVTSGMPRFTGAAVVNAVGGGGGVAFLGGAFVMAAGLL